MLKEIEKKDGLKWRIMPLEDSDGNLVRESKPFRSDGKSRGFIVTEMYGYSSARDSKTGIMTLGKEAEWRIIKIFWEHRHPKTYKPLVNAVDNGDIDRDGFFIKIDIEGNAYEEMCDPYYPINSNGEFLTTTDSEGNSVRSVFNRVRFFCTEAETPALEYDRAISNLLYVGDSDVEDEITIEQGEENQNNAAQSTPPPVNNQRNNQQNNRNNRNNK